MRIAALALLCALTACDGAAPPAAMPPPAPAPTPAPAPAPGPVPAPAPTPVGACDNLNVNGACTFAGVHAVQPETGAPLPPDAPPGADGTLTFAADYALADGSGVTASVFVQATPADREALERFYGEHRDATCAGIVLRAPCPPGVHVTVQVPAPPVGTVVRGPL